MSMFMPCAWSGEGVKWTTPKGRMHVLIPKITTLKEYITGKLAEENIKKC